MTDENRQHKRIKKHITILFCLADASPQKWDMSFVDNISAGGVKFVASSDLKLVDTILQLQIKIPELSPRILKLDAKILSVTPRFNGKSSDVRAQFLNLSEKDKEEIAALEAIINK